MSKAEIKWGILGPGHIARSFARGLHEAEGARLAAVGSRELGRARAFATEFGISNVYGSYEELAADPEVDAIYVATPHSLHEAHATLCLQAGKHVLCEKPLAVNASQARRMARVAAAESRVLMEAFWTRFLPAIISVREQIAAGVIGETRHIQADFGFRAKFDPRSRLFAPELAGGALLDIGIYPLNLAFLLCGPPTEIHATTHLGSTGVDEESAILLRHRNGESSQLYCSLRADTPREAVITGTEGRLNIEFPWWQATRFTVHTREDQSENFEFENRGGGYSDEAEAFMEMIRSGTFESKIMPLSESIAILQTMDEIREIWGLSYPAD